MNACKMLRQCFFVLGFIVSSPLWADQLIIEPDMGAKPIINAIHNAHHSVHLVMYGFTNKNLLLPLLEQKQRGRSVKILLESEPYKAMNENDAIIQKLIAHQVDWHGTIPPFRLIHQKTLIIDGAKAIVMTFNFTHSTFRRERNFALVIDKPIPVNEIEAVFSADWNHKAINPQLADLIWSPDNSREKLLALIHGAQKSLYIYAQNLNDYKLVGALAKAAKNNVAVKILTSNRMRAKQWNYLRQAGVSIHYSKKYFIHAKAFIIDHKKAVLGSINLTSSSMENNRELSVVTTDPVVIDQLTATFNADWHAKTLGLRGSYCPTRTTFMCRNGHQASHKS